MIKGVILIGVGRNLNRAIRTCYSFGVYNVYCYQCAGLVKGGLFSAEGRGGYRYTTWMTYPRLIVLPY